MNDLTVANGIGTHVILDLNQIEFNQLNDLELWYSLFDKACEIAGVNILNKYGHRFEPQGITVVYVLSESHISVHTWPEKNTAWVDIFTCGCPEKANLAGRYIKDYFKSESIANVLKRG